MRKELFILVFVILICSGSAITTNLADSYKQKQTVTIKIDGSILQPLQESQVKLKRGNTYVAFERGLASFDDAYYLWIVTPGVEGNYKLVIENIQSIVNGQSQLVTYEKNFNVTNESEDYYITPGVEVASADFYVTAVNGKDVIQQISVDFPNRHINLYPGETNIFFPISEFAGTQTIDLNVGKYQVPAKIFGIEISTNSSLNNTDANFTLNNTNTTLNGINVSLNNSGNGNFSTIVSGNYSFLFVTPIIKTNLSNSSTNVSVKFQIKNDGEDEIKNLKFFYNKEYFFIDYRNETIEPNKSREFNLVIKKAPGKYYRGSILAKAGSFSKYMVVMVDVANQPLNKPIVEYVMQNQSNLYYYCNEIDKDARVCSAEQSCSGNEVDSLDGKCCIGQCETPSSGRGVGSWIGYLIGILLIIVIGYVFLKYRKVNSNKERLVKEKFATAERKLP